MDNGDASTTNISPVFNYLNNKTQFWSAINSKVKPGQGVTPTDLDSYKGENGESLLHAAIKAGNKDIADELIGREINLLAVDKDGKTPLHYAIENGNTELAQQLLKMAPNAAEIVDNNNKSPLHYAAEEGNVQLAKAIGEKFPLMIGNRDSNGKNALHYALHYAIEQNNIGVAQELFNLSPGAAKLQDENGKTPLHYAVEAGRSDFVEKIITKDPSLVDITDEDGKTPLHHAAEKGKIKSAEALLVPFNGNAKKLEEIITKPSGANGKGPSAGELLIIAYAGKKNAQAVSEPNFPEMIKLLKIAPELAANPKVQEVLKKTVDAEGKNILHYLDSKSPILEAIVKAAPELATQLDKLGKNPLHYAAEKGNADLFDKIIEAMPKKDVDKAIATQDKDGNTAFHLAAANGHKAMLGDKSQGNIANLSAVNKNGQTPREAAQASGKTEIVKLLDAQEHELAIEAAKNGNIKDLNTLLNNNPDLLNKKDIDGNSLLHHAAMAGKNEIVVKLLGNGADITATNVKSQSAREVVGGTNKAGATNCAQAIHTKEKDAIFAAVDKGDKALVDKLLKQNPDLLNATNEKNKGSKNLIHIAAEKGHTEIISELIAKGAKVDFQDGQGKTALHYASENLHDDVITKLNEAGAKTDVKDSQGQEAATSYDKALLLKHVREGNLEETKKLLNKELVTVRDKDGKSILHIAAEMGHKDIALAIIKSNPELAGAQDSKERTPYHYSAAEGHNDISNALVNTKGTDISNETVREARKNYEDIEDGDKKTANHLFKEFQVIKAVRDGKIQELSERVREKSDLINVRDKDGNNLLHIAIASNQMELVEKLVTDKPQLLDEKNKDGKTPIETSLEKSDYQTFDKVMKKIKLDKKALLEGEKGKNNGLYHKALAQGKLEHAEVMLFSLEKADRLAIIAIPDKEGKTLLHLAAEKDNYQVVSKVLVSLEKEDRLAIVAIPDKEGRNLLHLAAEKGNDQVVSNVLDLVKNVTNEELVNLLTAKDKNGDTPLHSAAKAGNRDIFEAFAEKVDDKAAAENGINLVELKKIFEEAEKKKLREMEEKLAKEKEAENAKSASAQNSAQQAASSPSQSNEQKGAAYSKEDFLNGAIDSVKFTPCTGEEKKFNSNNQRAMSDPAITHLSERRNEDGSFSYELKKVEPNSPTKLHKIDGQFGELIFNGAGEMIGAEIKDSTKLHLLGKEQREQAVKLNEERAQGMTKASSLENLAHHPDVPSMRQSLSESGRGSAFPLPPGGSGSPQRPSRGG